MSVWELNGIKEAIMQLKVDKGFIVMMNQSEFFLTDLGVIQMLTAYEFLMVDWGLHRIASKSKAMFKNTLAWNRTWFMESKINKPSFLNVEKKVKKLRLD